MISACMGLVFIISVISANVLLIRRLKSSVTLFILGKNVCFGTKFSIWNQDFLNTLKLPVFRAECHPMIVSISFLSKISCKAIFTACVHIPFD